MPPRPKKSAVHDKPANGSPNSNSPGLAHPGRRISRNKSAGSTPTVDGTNGINHGFVVSPESSPVVLDRHVDETEAEYQPERFNGSITDDCSMFVTEKVMATQASLYRGRTVSFSTPHTSVEMDSPSLDASVYNHSTPLRIDVTAARPTRQRSQFAMATTILKACPLLDVITLLIIFLSLPSAALTLVQILFTAITIAPTFSGSSESSPTFTSGLFSSTGTLSLHTIVLVDSVGLMFYSIFPGAIQNLVLDLAQAVIAISLGGAATSMAGTGVLVCMVVIALSHILRLRSIQQLGLNLVWSSLTRYGLCSADSPPPQLSVGSARLYGTHGWPTWIFGVHILTQGITRAVRRYLLQRERSDSIALAKKLETDSSSPPSASATPRSAATSPDLRAESGATFGSDAKPPGSLTSAPKERKKKKKASTEARVQQPFWAAIASTKVSVYKADESSRAGTDAELAAQGPGADGLSMGSVDFKRLLRRVWIMEVGATDISFGVCLPLAFDETEEIEERKEGELDGVYVRVNGAGWMSVKRRMVQKWFDEGVEYKTWEGRIYGLTPLSTYNCEFLREPDGQLLYQTTLITQPQLNETGKSTDHSKRGDTVVAVIPPPTTTLQPSSPTTTLRNSIHAAEIEAEKSRNNLKAVRKQHKTTLDRLHAQTDKEKSKLTNNGGNDERQRQRAKQLENSILKIKSDATEAEGTLAELKHMPVEDKTRYNEAKVEARDRQRRMDRQREQQEKAKKEADKHVASAKGDIDTLMHKRSRFEARQKEYLAKLSEVRKKMEQITAAQARRHRERRDLDVARRNQLQHLEMLYADAERQVLEANKVHANATQEVQQFEEWSHMQASMGPQASAPGTPDGTRAFPLPLNANPGILSSIGPSGAGSSSLPGSRPSSLHVNSSGTLNHGFTFPATSASGTNLSAGHRRRASSLEIEQFPSLYHQAPYTSAGIAAAAVSSAGIFSPASLPTSSSALLADSTALAPAPYSGLGLVNGSLPAVHPGLGTYNSSPSSVLPAPVGAEKYREKGRRKSSSSGGSHGSFSGSGAFGGLPTLATINGMPSHGVTGSSNANAGSNGSPRSFGTSVKMNGSAASPSAIGTPPPPIWERRLNSLGSGDGRRS
jgi:hypothetical protein